MVSPIVVANERPVDQEVLVAGPSPAKSTRVENSSLDSLTAALKEEITSEIKTPRENPRENHLNCLNLKQENVLMRKTKHQSKMKRVVNTPLLSLSE